MKLLIISDTHNVIAPTLDYISQNDDIDHIIHLGDMTADAREIALQCDIPVTAVIGNNDKNDPEPAEIIAEFGGVKMLLMHGHKYFVERGLTRALAAAESSDVHILMYGHTHMFYYKVHDKIHVINPGSSGGIRTMSATAAILEVDGGEILGFDMVTFS